MLLDDGDGFAGGFAPSLMVICDAAPANECRVGASMAIYKALYFPVLMSCCIVTAGYAIHWIMNGGDIDLGPPNARVGEQESR